MEKTQLKITGMMCEACVGHVKNALQEIPGVTDVTVDLQGASATVQHEGADVTAMIATVEEEGYEAQPA